MSNEPRVYFGQPGHFVGAKDCRFHLHTHLRGLCVSTVGDWWPRSRWILGEHPAGPEEIGDGRLYETMVFEIQPDGDTNGRCLLMDSYDSRDAANAGHEQIVADIEQRGGLP